MIDYLMANPVIALLTAAVVIMLIVVIILLTKISRAESVSKRLDEIENAVKERVQSVVNESGEQARRSREELSGNLRGMGDSVTRVMDDMVRTQQTRMDAFAEQLRGMNADDERRIADMHRSVDGRLAAYEGRLDRIGTVLDDKMTLNEQRMDRIRETLEDQMSQLRADNGRRIDEMKGIVDRQLGEALEQKLGESFQTVSDRLDQVYRGLGEMQALASGVGDLRRVLTDVRTRGTLGNIQLGSLLEQVLSPEQYEKDVCLGEAVCNYAVKLPAQDGCGMTLLPIDAQFPQETYHRLLAAFDSGSPTLIEQVRGGLETELISRAIYIHDHFICPPATSSFAVMFLPVEGLYAEALHREGLFERLQRDYGVTLAGPTTLSALLNSLQMGFRTLAIEQRSNEVWALLGAVRGDLRQFGEAIAATQEQMQKAQQSIDSVASRSRSIEDKLSSVKRLNVAGNGRLEESNIE